MSVPIIVRFGKVGLCPVASHLSTSWNQLQMGVKRSKKKISWCCLSNLVARELDCSPVIGRLYQSGIQQHTEGPRLRFTLQHFQIKVIRWKKMK